MSVAEIHAYVYTSVCIYIMIHIFKYFQYKKFLWLSQATHVFDYLYMYVLVVNAVVKTCSHVYEYMYVYICINICICIYLQLLYDDH